MPPDAAFLGLRSLCFEAVIAGKKPTALFCGGIYIGKEIAQKIVLKDTIQLQHMNDIIQFFRNLFSTDLWPPRWHCGTWSNFQGWLYIVSDLTIWAAYFLIPIIILNYFSKKKTKLHFQRGYTLFASFILLCGTTHFLDAMMFWIPMYGFNTLVRFITAVVSMCTAYYLFKILPGAFSQKTNVELEKEIAHRQEIELKLEDANAKLFDANKDLEAFAYIASHDLKEPLRKIIFFSALLQNTNSLNNDGKNYLDKVSSSATRLNAMIDEILSLSTLRDDIEMNDCDVSKVIQQALKDLELKMLEKNALIEVKALPRVQGNENYLVQIFSNLLTNAVKFSKEQPHIEIYGETVGDSAIVYVRDNGIGMDAEYTDTIFKPFFRLHGKKEYEGFGIGLAICKKITDIHKGTIRAESEIGKGTTFIITLPAGQ